MTSQLTLGGSLPNAITKELAARGITARDGLTHLVPRWAFWSLSASVVAGGYLLVVERHTDAVTRYALAVALVITAVQAMMSRILIGAMLGEGCDLLHIAMTGLLPQAVTTFVIGGAFAIGIRWNAVEVLTVTIVCLVVVSAARLRLLAKPTQNKAAAISGRELWALARRTHIGSVGPIDGLAIDRALVGSLLGNNALGLYSAAYALAGLTSLLGGCLALVILPRIVIAQADPVVERQLVRRWLVISVSLIAVVVAVLEFAAGPVIRIAFGEEFAGAIPAAHWLVAAGGLLDVRRVFIAVLQGRGRGGVASIIELALTPLVVVGIIFASAHNSLVGVGVTMVAVAATACLAFGIAVADSAATVDPGPEPSADGLPRQRAALGRHRR